MMALYDISYESILKSGRDVKKMRKNAKKCGKMLEKA